MKPGVGGKVAQPALFGFVWGTPGCLWCPASKLTPYVSLLDASPEKPRRIIIATGLDLAALSREIKALIKA